MKMKKNNLFFSCPDFSKRFLSILILLVFQQISFSQEYEFTTKEELQTAVDSWVSDQTAATTIW